MKYNLLELFKGTGSVSKAFGKDFNIVSLDFDPIFTPTIETDILKWNYKKYFKDSGFIPNMIWASPPCNTYSPLAYPLKERDTKTAEPFSDRAKEGTKILYRTLDIINYVKKNLNPDVLFVIENPRGMMRNDPKIKKLILNSTLYCLYGDDRKKPTDFFSNFPLNLKTEKQCNKKTVPITDIPLKERYRIPQRLLKDIKDEFEDNMRR
jgi:site-specific DNA-cytosine methylase